MQVDAIRSTSWKNAVRRGNGAICLRSLLSMNASQISEIDFRLGEPSKAVAHRKQKPCTSAQDTREAALAPLEVQRQTCLPQL